MQLVIRVNGRGPGFEFRSRLLQRLIGVLFNEAIRRMVAAFEARARALYGPGG